MRFSYAETFCDPDVPRAARAAAEDAGYDSFVVPDSVIFPAESDTRYPYTADGDRAFLEDKPIIEPFTLIPYLAARTSRHPLHHVRAEARDPARRCSSPSRPRASRVLSDDRLRLGVGISPWPEDFAAMDVPWEKRGERMDETIDIVRGLTAGGWFEYDGERRATSTAARSARVPSTPIPILIGGHADVALRARRAPGRRLDPRGRRSRPSSAK